MLEKIGNIGPDHIITRSPTQYPNYNQIIKQVMKLSE